MNEYWEQRKDLNYYKQVNRWLQELTEYKSLIDVGSADTPVATFGEFKSRTAINNLPFPQLGGVTCIQADWMETDLKADVITCLQVLEHFEADYLKRFVEKIFRSSRVAILSVPYLWPEGACEGHKQAPVNIQKFLQLTGREPERITIVKDGTRERLVSLFKGDL